MAHEQRQYAHVTPPRGSYSPAIRDGDWLFIAGHTAGATVDAPEDLGDMAAQAEAVFRTLGSILEAEGGSYNDLVTMSLFITEPDGYQVVNDTRRRLFGDARPASTMVVVSSLARPQLKIEINATAHLNQG
jgi:2-iminobutanoate/2-iminopropanoate deaminase